MFTYYCKKNYQCLNEKIILYEKNLIFLLTNAISFVIIVEHLWKVSSVGRASALQAEGHRFEPCTFHHRQNTRHDDMARTDGLEVGAVVNDS